MAYFFMFLFLLLGSTGTVRYISRLWSGDDVVIIGELAVSVMMLFGAVVILLHKRMKFQGGFYSLLGWSLFAFVVISMSVQVGKHLSPSYGNVNLLVMFGAHAVIGAISAFLVALGYRRNKRLKAARA